MNSKIVLMKVIKAANRAIIIMNMIIMPIGPFNKSTRKASIIKPKNKNCGTNEPGF